MKLIPLILTIILFTSFSPKVKEVLLFPNKIGIIQSCVGDSVEFEVEIYTNSSKKIALHSFELTDTDCKFYFEGKQITKKDSIVVSSAKPITIKVEYILSNQKPTTLQFSSTLNKYSTNEIALSYGNFWVNADDIENEKEQIINLSQSCSDSICIFFPSGGSVTAVSIFKIFEDSTYEEFTSTEYDFMSKKSPFVFHKSDTGNYFVNYSSCHWGGNFPIVIK
ncbi:MAG: hypothetical protein ACK476_05570 [Fluviicola sp.]